MPDSFMLPVPTTLLFILVVGIGFIIFSFINKRETRTEAERKEILTDCIAYWACSKEHLQSFGKLEALIECREFVLVIVIVSLIEFILSFWKRDYLHNHSYLLALSLVTYLRNQGTYDDRRFVYVSSHGAVIYDKVKTWTFKKSASIFFDNVFENAQYDRYANVIRIYYKNLGFIRGEIRVPVPLEKAHEAEELVLKLANKNYV